MGLVTILKKMKSKEKEMRILVLGLDNAGKTTMLKKFNNEDIDTIKPTLGFNIKTFDYEGYKLNFWDVGGQKSLRSYWKNYFEATDGLIWVVDSTDKQRLEDCATELHGLIGDEHFINATVLVLANKQDLPNAMSDEDLKNILNLESIENNHWNIVKCCAKTGENLLESIDWLVSDVADRLHYAI